MQASPKGLAILVRAGSAAQITFEAPLGLFIKLGLCRKSLGVMAPNATQRTALEKDRCADPLTIANGKFLNIKNQAVHIKVCTPDGR